MARLEKTVFFPPKVTPETEAFWNGCREHKLLVPVCRHCGKTYWPAGKFCPDCLSEDTGWKEASGKGTLYSYVVFEQAFHPSLTEKLPYVVATVDLEEGVRLVSNVTDCELEEIRCGMPVTVDWADGEQYTHPVFVPVKE